MSTHVGEMIRKYRIEKGMTQKKLGELCGIADSNIRKYETGKQTPKINTLQRIADALEVSIYNLMEFDEDYSISDKKRIIKYLRQLESGINHIEMSDFVMTGLMYQLNDKGQEKAIEQVELLTKIPEYRKETTDSDKNTDNSDK